MFLQFYNREQISFHSIIILMFFLHALIFLTFFNDLQNTKCMLIFLHILKIGHYTVYYDTYMQIYQ